MTVGTELRMTRLGDLIAIKHGFAFLGEHFGDFGSHVVLTPGNFLEEGGFISKAGKEKWYRGPVPSEYVLRTGDLLVAMTEQAEGLLGSSLLVPEDDRYLHNQRLGLVKVRDPHRTDTRFLYYLFNHRPIRQQIRGSASGTKIRHTSPSRIADVKALVPQVAVQRRIASILSAYDDLIENCQRRIRLLEDMARGLYREWFVHFRFPGADALPRVDSPLGPIPKGWLVCALSDIAVVHRGRSYRSVDLADEGGLPFVNLKCLNRDGGFRRSGLKRYTGDFKPENVVRKGDIVIAVTDMTQERRIVARAAWVPSLDREHGVLSMDMVGVEPLTGIPKAFLYAFLRFSSFANEVKQHANGANVLHLSPDRIRDYQLALPLRTLIGRFAGTYEPILALADALENRIEVLRRTRDLLLPRLLSGQIDLGLAEKSAPA